VLFWLQSIGYSHFSKLFKRNEIDGETLLTLTDDDFKEMLINCNSGENKAFLREWTLLLSSKSKYSYNPLAYLQFNVKINGDKQIMTSSKSKNSKEAAAKDNFFVFLLDRSEIQGKRFEDFITALETQCRISLKPYFEFVDNDGDLIKITKNSQFQIILNLSSSVHQLNISVDLDNE